MKLLMLWVLVYLAAFAEDSTNNYPIQKSEENYLLVATVDGHLHYLDAKTGNEKWSVKLDHPFVYSSSADFIQKNSSIYIQIYW